MEGDMFCTPHWGMRYAAASRNIENEIYLWLVLSSRPLTCVLPCFCFAHMARKYIHTLGEIFNALKWATSE
jgi:hypothetical protein